jgi:hypothetical protein
MLQVVATEEEEVEEEEEEEEEEVGSACMLVFSMVGNFVCSTKEGWNIDHVMFNVNTPICSGACSRVVG